ncbi:MAG: hypothetical protein BWY76_02449 [bacterium ADurb.Bin429]|nr:MAG: hypothetical protein BWY76_02449 [bacterium ADurb.Bin429]
MTLYVNRVMLRLATHTNSGSRYLYGTIAAERHAWCITTVSSKGAWCMHGMIRLEVETCLTDKILVIPSTCVFSMP